MLLPITDEPSRPSNGGAPPLGVFEPKCSVVDVAVIPPSAEIGGSRRIDAVYANPQRKPANDGRDHDRSTRLSIRARVEMNSAEK